MFKRMILSAITLLAMAPLTATNQGLSVKLTGNSLELVTENDSLSKDEAEVLCDKLLKNPLSLLSEIKKYEHELQELFEAVSDGKAEFDPAAMAETFQKQRTLNPIFLVEECYSGQCGLSRNQNSSRSFYESVVLKYLKKYKNQERINLVSFASGGMFQDLIILAKSVKLHGISNINIHLIDTKYTSYTQALSGLNHHVTQVNLCNDRSSAFYTYSLSKESEKRMQQKCEMYLTVMHEQLRQFVSLVQVLSDKNIKIYIHKDAASYQKNCIAHPDLQADLLIAMDFGPNPFVYKGMLRDYYSLIYHSLKAGGVAIFADDMLKLNCLDIIGFSSS